MKNNILIALIMLCLITSCKQVIDDHYPYFEPCPSLNSITIEGDSINILASYVTSPDSINPTICHDAIITLYVDGENKETLFYDNTRKCHRGNTIMECGREYRYEATFPDGQTLTASTIVPYRPTVVSYELIPIAGLNDDGSIYQGLRVFFLNDTTQRLYYYLRLKESFVYNEEVSVKIKDQTNVIDDPILFNEGLPLLAFSNEIITSDTASITFNAITPIPEYETVIELFAIPYDYYKYLKSYYLYHSTASSFEDIVIGTMTPFNVHSNVNNGLGIVAGVSMTQYELNFKEGGQP